MKVRKTLLFMLSNPVPFIAYLLACWILFSALITISDDPFTHGTLPDAAEAAEGAFANLPGSLWKLVTALSIITEEIVSDLFLYYQLCLFVIPLALTFSYREARSSRNGIAMERQVWMQWSDRQQVVRAERGTYETPPLSEHIPGGSYFISARKTVRFMLRHPTLPIGHFVCWISVFTLLILFDTSDFVRSLPKIVIPAVIFTLILSYREARGNLKRAAMERHIWTKWYYQQIRAIVRGDTLKEPPSSEKVRTYSNSGEVPETLNFIVRNNLRPLIVHLACWITAFALLFFMTLRPEDTPEDILEIFDLIGYFGHFIPWIAAIIFIISYREARGNLKGIAKTQQVWMQWYHQQQETIRQGDTFEEPPPLENIQADSYFRKAQKAILSILLNPMLFMIHFIKSSATKPRLSRRGYSSG